MYEEAFNLTSRPFTSMHYVKHYYPAKAINESLETCQAMIDRGAGPVLVIGDHGTGKTLLLAMLEEEFQTSLRVVNLSAEAIRSREDLVQNTLFQLQLNYKGLSENEMRLELVDYLRRNDSTGILMLIDNAQKLTADVIEEVQPLLDFIQDEKPQIRLVIAGSQGIEDRLADSRLVTFNQRIAARCFLSCLGCEEVEAYVRSHLIRSAGNPDSLFDEESWRAIYEVTEGRPRFINQVCDHALIFSATRGVVPVTDSLVREAWYDIQRLPGSVAPAKSGASISDTPIVSQPMESVGEDGWTVLEFGELDGDSDGDEAAAVAVESSGFSIESDPEPQAEPEPETVADADAGAEEPSEPSESSAPVAGAAILATAMAGFGASQIASDSPAEEAQPPETPPPASEDASGSPLAQDPFNTYQFDNEEVLTDAYSPYVAQQNQRSLEVTSEQLQNLTPNDGSHDANLDQLSSGHSAEVEETFPTIESATNPKPEPAREPQRPTIESRGMQETRDDANADAKSLTEEFEIQSSADAGPAEAQPGSGYVPLDPNTPHPSLESESYSQTAAQEAAEMQRAVEQAQTYDQKVEQGIVAPETESAASDSEAYKGQQDDTSDPEIRRQAEEIIRALRESEDEEEFASAATSITGAIDQETSAIESTIQNSINASAASAEADSAETPALVMPGALAIQQALQNTPQVPPTQNVVAPGVPDVITPRVVPPADEAATPENETTEVAIDPVEPERRILDEVREQQAMVAPTITDGDESSQDDRDMISMEKEQVVSTPESEPAEMPAWTHKEPSSGEANRVDYQKLFDQLRDVQDQQES